MCTASLRTDSLSACAFAAAPGTIAIAAAIQNKYNIPVIPHIICSGATKEDIEYELLDLQFLGIENLLLLRGDKAKEDSMFKATPAWAMSTPHSS